MAECASGGLSQAEAIVQSLPGRICFWRFPLWKRRYLRRIFTHRELVFVQDGAALRQHSDAVLILWGSTPVPAPWGGTGRVLRMEDGFLRSVGLGAELTRPLSWVLDDFGMYYDASRPSRLENLLQHSRFATAELERARQLRERIVAGGISKYNVGAESWVRPPGARRIILVPGQVESDAAIAAGCPELRSNLALLQAVRREHPDAFLLYKPHPDVFAGLRRRGDGEDHAPKFCDQVLGNVPMERLLDQVDEVHTLTSLAGFEALLRNRPVTCHGQPFYAGWGLTRDRYPLPRRERRLTLDELVAGVLLAYPLYIGGRGLTGPEEAISALERWKARRQGRTPPWRGIYRAILRRAIGVR